jgi:predicted nucleotidyltransferase/HEPN domain-containing protein
VRTIDDSLIEDVARVITEQFNPRRIVLFGSHARGDAGPESDLDLFVEIETRDRRNTAAAIQHAISEREWPMDIIVFTPDDVAQWTGQIGTILYDVEREGKVLYDRRETIPMSPSNPPYPPYRAWLEKADNDALTSERLIVGPPIPWDVVCFHAQQSAEKVLKGLLVFRGEQPRKTHELDKVLAEGVKYEPTLQALHAACVLLNPYGVDPRYLNLSSGPSEQEGRAAVAAMHRIRTIVLALLPA